MATVIKVSVRPRAVGFVLAQLLGLGWLGNIPNEEALGLRRFAFDPAPTGGDLLERCDHLSFGDLDLDRPGILGARDEGDKLGRSGVGDDDPSQNTGSFNGI